MARKKKQSRKYEPRHEFRINNSPHAGGHPHYVFGEKNGKYKSLGLTTSPSKNIKHVKLTKNPNPNDASTSYLQIKEVHTANKKYYSSILPNWMFARDDMGIVRHRTKKYKKSYNRKPPMYYENKKKNKKK